MVDGDTLFQRMLYLRGMEALFVDLIRGRDEVFELRDRICQYMLARINHWHELGVDGFRFRDDWGSQRSLLINPKLWRSFFKPSYARLFEAVHAGGGHVIFHSDGMIKEILPDLIELGVDVLHPQMELVSVDLMAREYKGKMCFMSDPDRQIVLPFGTPKDVERHIFGILDKLYDNGGVIGWAELGSDVPWENIKAVVRAFAEWQPI
jgi:uroporphyrinogen-III decarboxylase